MAENKSVAERLQEILKSLDERIAESKDFLDDMSNTDEEDIVYHEGREEALEITRKQINTLFAEELKS